jgi:hypothetical protein
MKVSTALRVVALVAAIGVGIVMSAGPAASGVAAGTKTVPNFTITNASFSPAIETTTFVQSQPGAPLGTPCALYPTLPTTVTATATVKRVAGQMPDSVVVDVDTYPAQRIYLSPVRPGSTTWKATFPIAGVDTQFLANPYHYFAQFIVFWHNISMGNDEARAGLVRACA